MEPDILFFKSTPCDSHACPSLRSSDLTRSSLWGQVINFLFNVHSQLFVAGVGGAKTSGFNLLTCVFSTALSYILLIIFAF